jgi:hypothetical protein
VSYVIDESIDAKNFTPAHLCPQAFGYARVIESITIHHWGNRGQRFDDVVGYLASKNARGSSAHFIVEDGRITCIVSPVDASWHAGNAYGSATSIGIECRPEATDGDYETVAWLIRFLRDTYGAGLPLIPHNYWTNTACPGVWDLARLDQMARQTTVVPQGGTVATFHPGEDWYNAMIHAQARIDKRTNYVKSKNSPTIYDISGGTLRGLIYEEWVVLESAGHRFEVVDQHKIDAWLAKQNDGDTA